MGDISIDGIDEIISKFMQLENVPKTVVTSAAKTGANMALSYALKNLEPQNVQGDYFLGRKGKSEQHIPGTLLAMLRLKMETSPKGKTVYQITTTWYAHFFDYRFTDPKGMQWEGTHFLKRALTEHYAEIESAMTEELLAGIEKVLGGV